MTDAHGENAPQSPAEVPVGRRPAPLRVVERPNAPLDPSLPPGAGRLLGLLVETTAPDGERPREDVPWYTWDALEGALIDAIGADADLALEAESQAARIRRWAEFLELVRPLGGRTRYIGSFRKQVWDAARLAADFFAADRLTAARVLIDRTVLGAGTWQDFREGMRAATSLDRSMLAPETAIQTIAVRCFRHVHTLGPERPAMLHGLQMAFELMAKARGPFITGLAESQLRAILDSLTPEQRASVQNLATVLDRRDQRTIKGLVDDRSRDQRTIKGLVDDRPRRSRPRR